MSDQNLLEFQKQFLSVFSEDVKTPVSLFDTPYGLDLDSLDLVEIALELEDSLGIPDISTGLKSEIYTFVKKPLGDLCAAVYDVYNSYK
jgi:acyl carrier protein